MLENLDHILLGCRDLDEGIAYLEKFSGYRAAFGGAHPGRGTRNALLKMGPHAYLEIIAPDPHQNQLAWLTQLASLSRPLLVGYAIRIDNLDDYAVTLRKQGIAVNGPETGSRVRPDGQVLRWTTLLYLDDRGGMLPFFIDWDASSPHPSTDAPGAIELLSFERTGELPDEFTSSQDPQRRPLLPDQPVQLRAFLKGLHGEFELVSHSFPPKVMVPDPPL